MTSPKSQLFHTPYDPLVTIAIPTFNRGSWLKDCIAAALAQSYQRYEIVVSDNASTDQTEQILNNVFDRRLRVVRQRRNIGQLPNWNACIAEAKGDYIIFVSDDDRIAPWLLERCVEVIKSEPQTPIVIALSDVFFVANGRTWHAPVNRKLGTGIWDGVEVLEELLKEQISAPMCSVMIRTETLRAKGGFPVELPTAADSIVCASILLAGRAGFVNETCGTVCVHEANETSRLAFNTRISCQREYVDLIAKLADSSIQDRQKRRTIKLEAKRFFVRYAIRGLASCRRGGTKLTEVLPQIWQWRQDFCNIGIKNFVKLAKPLAVVLVPATMTRSLVNFARMLRQTKLIISK